ncbi:hypothetical protein TcasGA2_TC015851 [Tribolium castaneum]|uniref:Uncharacterized protein n=1 Tax=Tribolium castaneum TaxID=7070 RepID=D2A4A6_TRICA|nr:hypothetical protein TcasGA2_TC015851 [Tribolium castaneum]
MAGMVLISRRYRNFGVVESTTARKKIFTRRYRRRWRPPRHTSFETWCLDGCFKKPIPVITNNYNTAFAQSVVCQSDMDKLRMRTTHFGHCFFPLVWFMAAKLGSINKGLRHKGQLPVGGGLVYGDFTKGLFAREGEF